MKTTIEVADRKEGELLRAGLDHAPTRALVRIVGHLLPLNDRQRRQVLGYVADMIENGEIISADDHSIAQQTKAPL
jgi:hypothetical protein